MTTTLVKRPARIDPPAIVDEPLSIAPPPNQGQPAPALAGASMMMMPIMGGTGSITVAITQQGRPIVAVAAFLALIGSIAIGVLMMISQRSGTKRQVRESRERYLDYIEALRHSVRHQIAGQRAEQAWRFPRTDELMDIARDDARRWERRTSHPDFLGLRVGTGDVPLRAGLTLDADTGPLNEFDPVCLQAAQELQQRYAVLRDQPITVPLALVSTFSVVGHQQVRRTVATGLLTQLMALQSPNDLSIAVVRSDEAAPEWDWLKWSPHLQDPSLLDGDLPARRVQTTVAAMQEMLAAEFEARLDRHQRARGSQSAQPNHLVVLIDGEGLPANQHLASPEAKVALAELGVHVILLLDDPRQEPDHVDVRMTVERDGVGRLSIREEPFTLDLPEPGLGAFVARTLSPLRLTIEDSGSDDELAQTVGLPEILGVPDPAKLDLRRTWRPRALRDLLRVPIGVGNGGNAVLLDLKESAHGGMGPHGMVVGATGSGKSEMLRTMVSSLIIGHGPDRLALMLVDFKGGATFAAMEDIPHMAGMITNLQDDLTLVDRMRDALFGEMQRRQEILKRAGNLPNVTAYQDRIDAGEDLEPLPHLLVIIDEFSELLTAKPDFADLFVAIGRIGRSIGVHLLLATQKLEMGKIRGLESHLSYRISLRTFSEGESRDAIGVPDAFYLPPEPGSGYLKVDTTVFERFKAALVSSPYVPPSKGVKTTVPVVPYVAVNGLGAWLAAQSSEVAREDGAEEQPASNAKTPSVLDVLCDQISSTGAAKVRPVWLDPLPDHLPLGNLVSLEEDAPARSCSAYLGTVDDPAKQHQYPLEWDFTGAGANLVIVGSPSTGKSTLIRTLVTSMAMRYRPGDVAFYVIDYGGGSLSPLAGLPHVATVTSRVDPERIQRTVNDVRSLLNRREQLFREKGLDSMAAYRRAREAGELPGEQGDVFLIVDGWGTFREEYDDLDYAVADLAARGANFGVHVIVTVTQGMQVRMRMMSAMGGRIELRMNDAYDSEFERKMMEQVSKDAPGRGLTGDRKKAWIFQSAVPALVLPFESLEPGEDIDDSHLQTAQAELFSAITEKWGDTAVSKVEVLPSVVRLSELPAIVPGSDDLLVGLSEMNLGPARVSLMGTDPHIQVYGDAETGKTNMLKLMIANLVGSKSPDEIGIAVIDYRRTLLDVVPDDYLLAYASTADQADSMINQLTHSFRERLPGPGVTSEQLRNRSWWDGLEVFIIVDDYDLVSTSSGDPLLPLVDLLAQGRDLGFHLILSRRTGGLSRAIFEPVIQRFIDLGAPGFMFSGDRLEGRLIGGHVSRRLPKGRAMFVNRDGQASLVQTALVDDPES